MYDACFILFCGLVYDDACKIINKIKSILFGFAQIHLNKISWYDQQIIDNDQLNNN
jgi:hypothetical protein